MKAGHLAPKERHPTQRTGGAGQGGAGLGHGRACLLSSRKGKGVGI